MMRVVLIAALVPAAAFAHMISLSTGELRIAGTHARYELRLPTYEAAHVTHPEKAFFDHIRFADARFIKGACADRQGTYTCTADYEFPAPPETISVECTFASIVVPNHVHMLRAFREGKSGEAVFDLSYTSAEIRFRPPSAFEIAGRGIAAGITRAVEGAAPLLFLLAVGLAARSWREVGMLAAALFAGECVTAVVPLPVILAPRFIEAAAALSIAYLALETVLLPQSRREIVVCVLGLFHGAYFATLLRHAGYAPPAFLTGVVLTQAAALGMLYVLLRRLRTTPIPAGLLCAVGLAWFAARVWR